MAQADDRHLGQRLAVVALGGLVEGLAGLFLQVGGGALALRLELGEASAEFGLRFLERGLRHVAQSGAVGERGLARGHLGLQLLQVLHLRQDAFGQLVALALDHLQLVAEGVVLARVGGAVELGAERLEAGLERAILELEVRHGGLDLSKLRFLVAALAGEEVHLRLVTPSVRIRIVEAGLDASNEAVDGVERAEV